MLKLMICGPAEALALVMAHRNEPAPELLVLTTVKVAARAQAARPSVTISTPA